VDRERLAAYVAGELDADERAEIEARLARDPAARAELDRLQATERALGQLRPASPPAGFEERLRKAVAPALDEVLSGEPTVAERSGDAGADGDEAGDVGVVGDEAGDASVGDEGSPGSVAAWSAGGDELAARRRPGRWVTGAIGAAAAVALIGVAGVAILGVPGTEDAAPDVAMEADDADDRMMGADADGPVVVASDRELDADDLERLLAEPSVQGLRAQALDLATGGDLARAYRSHLQALDREEMSTEQGEASDAPTADAEDAEEPATEADEPAADPDDGAEAFPADGHERVGRCLDVILEGAGDPAPIPVYVELLRYEGEPAIAYGMLTPGGDGERYDRVEIWVVDQADCQVREFRQQTGTG
jgi:anti-sigma factor RsiW